MRTIALVAILVCTGCGSTKSLEDLESEAMISGDWTSVERRERQLRQQKRTAEFDCAADMTLVCVDNGSHEECTCMKRPRLP